MYDIFITHDWRANSGRDAAVALLDSQLGLNWRNFGTPWFDPAIALNSPEGNAFVCERLEEQVRPARVVLLIPELLESQRGRTWVGRALEIAGRQGIPVVGLLPETGMLASETASLARVWVNWDGPALIAAIDSVV